MPPALMSTMLHLLPGSPAACTFLVLASLSGVTAVIVIAGKAPAWVRENGPRRRDGVSRGGD